MVAALGRLEVSDRASSARSDAFDLRFTPDGVEVRNGSRADPGDHVVTAHTIPTAA